MCIRRLMIDTYGQRVCRTIDWLPFLLWGQSRNYAAKGSRRNSWNSPRRNRNTGSQAAFLCGFLLVLVFALPAPAGAHNINVFAYVEGDQVIAEGYFSDGRKCRDSDIEVFDSSGHKLLSGKTDAEGRFSFRPPKHADLRVRLTASMGHQAEYLVPASDLPGGGADLAGSTPTAEGSVPREAVSEDAPALLTDIGAETAGASDMAALEQAIDRSVARQILPLRRALEEERSRRRLSDIIGGIGYIVGVMGLIAYFRARRKRQE